MGREFDLALEAENRAPRTREAYGDALRLFGAFLAADGRSVVLVDIGADDVRAFLADQLRRLKPASVHTRYRSLRRFFAWCVEEGELDRSPMATVKPPVVPEQQVPVLTADQLRLVLKTCEGRSFVDRRDAALLSLLADTGLRRTEAATIRTDALNLDHRMVTVLGKGRRPRTVPFGARTARALVRYERERRAHPLAELPWLWLGTSGRTMSSNGVKQIVERRAAEAGLKVHAHMFRHTFAHAHLAQGGNEGDLMMLAGWKSRAMLTRYAASTGAERARVNYVSPVDAL